MPFLNNYTPSDPTPEQDYHLETPVGEYDLNFCLDVPESLSTPGGVLLVPVIPSLYASDLSARLSANPSLFHYIVIPPFTTLTSVLTFIESFRSDPSRLLFAIYDQSLLPFSSPPTAPHRLAGLIGVLDTSPSSRTTEIGPVIIFPEFQRTHVMTHSVALVLGWAFDDLKLRRVQWFTNERNEASIKAAERMGLKLEARLRWEKVLLAESLEGEEVPEWAREQEEKAGRGRGRHSALLAIGWDVWREEAKDKVAKLVAREVKPRTLERVASTPVE
ncbi:hypothetical protein RQP46_003837 [Phenoliferia psychrophenolica]